MHRQRLVHLSPVFGVKKQKCLMGYTIDAMRGDELNS